VIRRADTKYSSLDTTGQVFIQTSAASTVMATGTGSTWGTSSSTFPLFFDQLQTVAVPLRKYFVHIYFVSPCSVPAGGATDCTGSGDDNGHPIPTLKRLELSYNGAATQWTIVPLVEGIENMQLDYGMDTDGDGYPNNYITNPATSTDWSNVMAVRINLLARNIDCTASYQDTKTYNLGLASGITPASAVGCTNGDYRRHVFTEAVRAINPSSRRASQ
jgi:type IV pilus assembly protein PilW